MSIRDILKNEIDSLSDEALFEVREFVLRKKEQAEPFQDNKKKMAMQWLNHTWEAKNFEPIKREQVHDRV
ncbi:MAG: hypothetical protein LBR61_09875 [Synergistaceae bacterium]|jgi:hypothetical protein|nr:hypothetical protein [Synergistaceae bacterium]